LFRYTTTYKGSKIILKIDGGTLYFSLSLPSLSFFPSSSHSPLRSGPLNQARRSVDSDVARGLKGGTRKPDLPETFHECHTCEFGGESGALLSPEKIEFEIGRGAISACIEGSFAFFSLFLVDILSRSEFLLTPPHRISVEISTNCETDIFKKWCNPDLPCLRQC